MREIATYLAGVIQEKTEKPDEGVISQIAHARPDGLSTGASHVRVTFPVDGVNWNSFASRQSATKRLLPSVASPMGYLQGASIVAFTSPGPAQAAGETRRETTNAAGNVVWFMMIFL